MRVGGGVVDGNVHPAEGSHCFFHNPACRSRIAGVGDDCQGPVGESGVDCRGNRQHVFGAPAGDDHPRAGGDVGVGDGRTNTARAAGHNGHLTAQVELAHGQSFLAVSNQPAPARRRQAWIQPALPDRKRAYR